MSAVCLLLALLDGCSHNDKYASLGLVEVTGSVTWDNQLLSGAVVDFQSHTPGKGGSQGITDVSGQYRLMLNSSKSGVTPGETRVVMTLAPDGEDAALSVE